MFFRNSFVFSLSSDDDESSGKNYIVSAIVALIMVPLIMWIWPEAIPLGFWDLWIPKGSVLTWLYVGLPVFIWGAVITIINLTMVSDRVRVPRSATPGKVFVGSALVSAWAGITEEIAFRWLIFLLAVATVQFGNFLFFGFLGFGVAEWFHMNVWGPLVDWTTFGYLTKHIFSETGWYVGAAMLYSNAFFRDGYKYQGLMGVINSWFIGMFLFWVTFNYGLPAAILIHFLYDFLLMSVISPIYIMIRRPAHW